MLRLQYFLLPVGMLAFAFCLPLSAKGQTPVSQEVVDRYYAKAREICRSTPYRITLTIEDRASEDEAWRPYSQSIVEHADRKSHFIGKNLETITFGKTTYIKQRDGSWKEKVPVESRATIRLLGPIVTEWDQLGVAGSDDDENVRKAGKPKVKWVLEKSQGTMNGSGVTFLSESWVKVQYLSDGLIYEHHNTGKVIFDDQGRYVLTESISFEPRRQIFIRRLEVFEYDPNIKVELPVK